VTDVSTTEGMLGCACGKKVRSGHGEQYSSKVKK